MEKMLAFLSRDPRNGKRVAQLQQESKIYRVVKKSKKSIAQEASSNTQSTLSFPFPSECTARKPTSDLDVDVIISSFSTTACFQDCISSMSCAIDDVNKTIQITAGVNVPDNWPEVGQVEAEPICETFRLAEVDVLINADETFILFYPEDGHVIVLEGAKRVGSTNANNSKQGLTGMELFSSTVLPPFTVLDAATDGRLSKQWESYGGTAKICFQKIHWMDIVLAKNICHG